MLRGGTLAGWARDLEDQIQRELLKKELRYIRRPLTDVIMERGRVMQNSRS